MIPNTRHTAHDPPHAHTESILVIKGMGIQLQTHFADGQEAAQVSRSIARSKRLKQDPLASQFKTSIPPRPPNPPKQFLDLQRVRAVLINEGITMHRVVYYLAFVVEGRDRLLVAFPVRVQTTH